MPTGIAQAANPVKKVFRVSLFVTIARRIAPKNTIAHRKRNATNPTDNGSSRRARGKSGMTKKGAEHKMLHPSTENFSRNFFPR